MLYPLTGKFLTIYQRIEEADGNLDAANPLGITLGMDLDALEAEQSDTVEHRVALVRQCEMEADELEARAQTLMRRAAIRRNVAKHEREQLHQHMTVTGQARIDTPHGRVSVVRNGGKLRINYADAIDPATLPEQFVRVRREIDSEAVRDALDRGETLPFARFAERGTHLRIV